MDSITLTLSKEQTQLILQLIDAALRGGGVQHVRQAVELLDLLEAATKEAIAKKED
jgi:hypothetical protein